MHQFCFGSVKNNQISLINWSFFVKLTSLFNTHAFLQAFIQKICSFLLVYTSLFYGKRKLGVYQFCSGSVKISSLINKLIMIKKLTSLYNTHVFLRDLLIVYIYLCVLWENKTWSAPVLLWVHSKYQISSIIDHVFKTDQVLQYTCVFARRSF